MPGMLPPNPVLLYFIAWEVLLLPTSVIDPQLEQLSYPQVVNIQGATAIREARYSISTGAQQPSVGTKRKQAEAPAMEDTLAICHPQCKIQAPPHADRDVEVVPKAPSKKKAKASKS